METRFLLRASQRIPRPSLSHIQSRLSSTNASDSSSPNAISNQQAKPVGNYYSSMLTTPAVYASMYPSKHRNPAPPPPPPSLAFDTRRTDSTVESAILFSPRTVTKWERESDVKSKSVLVAGVWVPQKPAEPENCCMSGCVNCVWDLYGEELEEWAAAKKAADQALAIEAGKDSGLPATGQVTREGGDMSLGPASMDDDGGGTESNWGAGSRTGIKTDDLLKDVPVGIREFMKVEKMLKERHIREGARGDGR